MDIEKLVKMQRNFFNTGSTRPVRFRKAMLRRLADAVKDNEWLLAEAMKEDMNKSSFEVYMTETGLVLDEIRYHINHVDRWAKDKRVISPLAQFPSKSFVSPEPYGVALIMSPWNYPIQLCLEPLIGAISAGCTAVVKPSAYAPATSAAIEKIIHSIFPPKYIAVVQGGREENALLLQQKFDYIFFTGSPSVGHFVMESASKYLTPVTLELGGKSPVIVDETADLKIAARRIAFGKVLNAGQTCVEPDYLFIHESVKDEFKSEYQMAINEFFPDGNMSDMNVIINEKHYKRVKALLDSGTAVVGGGTDDSRRFVEPTLLDDVSLDSPIMQEEIFGPILPMLAYKNIDTCIEYIISHPRPLALYLFTENGATEKRILDSCSFGGGCINDTIIHLATSRMAFGGVGESGMGGYHGKNSFDTFSHKRSIVKKATWLDLPVRYRPYTEIHDKLIRFLMH
jgi:aldehyde dehydrogenase (NAD+)